MKRLLLVLAAGLVLLPGAAVGAACSPLNCAPSQFTLAHGTLLGFRAAAGKPVRVVDLHTGKLQWVLPAGITGGNLLVHQEGARLIWYDATSGAKLYDAALPSVEYSLAGVSQNGTRAFALNVASRRTTAAIVSRGGSRTITLPDRQWQFDALRGDNLFLIHFLAVGGYQVRLFHLGAGHLDAQPLKDPHESGTIWGSPFSRLASPDGRYLFTLYIGSNGAAMIHELDLKLATARCIDLPGTGDYGAASSWALMVSTDGRTVRAVSPGYGRVVAIDVHSRKVTDAFRIDLPYWAIGPTSAALSPDGRQIAIADGETVAVVDLTSKKIADRNPAAKTIALGYSPDGTTLWKLS
ncbi:MAG TPA: hypothetical protein VH108_06125 [Gaiellaceae bacterium]|jgi:hypothetical protein|nr:hypothetical protein [Gaiellaceae bacterium]